MNQAILDIIKPLDKEPTPDDALYQLLLEKIDFDIDPDFLAFIKLHDGAIGFTTSGEYLDLWSIENILKLNPYYDEFEESNSYFFFGSNGSISGYAFDKGNGNVLSVDFIGFYTEIKGRNFKEFLVNL